MGAICVTETWLSSTVPDSNITIPGFNLFRKDRTDTSGGGVCIYLKSTIPSNYLDYCDQSGVESLWVSARPHKLPRQITSIIFAVIYHSTRNRHDENIVLKDHLQKNLELILSKQPNDLVIITGDFNPITTGLKYKDIAQVNHLSQLVKFKTGDSGILDWFFTNRPKLFDLSQLPKIGSSDHFSILSKPITKAENKPTVRKIKIRDMRESAWRTLGRWMTQKDWSSVLNATTCEEKFDKLMSELHFAIDKFLPQRTVRKHPTDHPWITNEIKKWIFKRQTAFIRHGKDSIIYKFWRNKVQREIKAAKKHYYENRVADVEQTNPRKWWKQIKSLTGKGIQNEWYHQFLEGTKNTEFLANRIPVELLVTEEEVYQSLLSIDTIKAVGPDDIPNKLLKDFSFELAPVIKDIYNQSLKKAYVPTLLKSSIVIPIPKIVPPKDVESDLRPISLTCTIAKVMEGFTCTRLLSQLNGKMDPRQKARRKL